MDKFKQIPDVSNLLGKTSINKDFISKELNVITLVVKTIKFLQNDDNRILHIFSCALYYAYPSCIKIPLRVYFDTKSYI